jgi:polysaccharide export outer membrane protein
VLGVGDQLSIRVLDMDEISDKPMRIDSNGFIDLPLVGRVQAGGVTAEQLKTDLTKRLSKYIDDPQISINLTDDRSHPVSVIGAVNNPGVQQLQGARRLIEVISLAGGVRPDAGSTVTVTRQFKWGRLDGPGVIVDPGEGITTVTLPLEKLLNSKTPSENILIEPNDIVSIPKADIVYVLGNVRKAGGFALSTHGEISLLQALSLAEGLDANASSSKARILRPANNGDGKPREIPVDIPKIYRGQAEDVPLYANDVLFVPNSAIKASAKRATEAAVALATGVIIYH